MRCGDCGWEGAAEEVMRGMEICPSCGALQLEDGPDPLFQRTSFQRARRFVGRLADRISPAVLDAGGQPLARAMRTTSSFRMVLAWLGGAAALSALLLLDVMLLGALLGSGKVITYVLAPLELWIAMGVVAWLRPSPTLTLFTADVSREQPPRVLLRVAPEARRGFVSVLRVESGEGAVLGTIALHRLREVVYVLSNARPLMTIAPAHGREVVVRRASAWRPGWVFEQGGEPVASYGLNGGFQTRDELDVPDPQAVDPRLLVAATLLARP